MARRYNRQKLRSHDAGNDRHNKGVAWSSKQTRLGLEHQKVTSGRKPKKQSTLQQQLEAAANFLDEHGVHRTLDT